MQETYAEVEERVLNVYAVFANDESSSLSAAAAQYDAPYD